MATISNTPRPGYAWDATDNCWYPIGTGPHTHSDYISQSTAINPTIVDAKGDIITATAADTPARLAVGTNGQLLYADSTAATGLKWDAAPASGGLTLLNTTTITTSGTTNFTWTSIPTTYKKLRMEVLGGYNDYGKPCWFNFNGDTGSNYQTMHVTQGGINNNNSFNQYAMLNAGTTGGAATWLGSGSQYTTVSITDFLTPQDNTHFWVTNGSAAQNGTGTFSVSCSGKHLGSAAITSIKFQSDVGDIYGTFKLYGVN